MRTETEKTCNNRHVTWPRHRPNQSSMRNRRWLHALAYCHTPTDGGNIGMRRTNCSKHHNTM
ncbi:hypothetical protein HanRHA438_Chr01g0040311 [Helianthus annuus]|nr:hypothetical protein HanRHA438_Chr01g0040311 [Helianthus annuus]